MMKLHNIIFTLALLGLTPLAHSIPSEEVAFKHSKAKQKFKVYHQPTRRTIGKLEYDFLEDECCISFIKINRKFRGQGLGTMLLQKVEKLARREHCDRLALTVYPYNNEDARRLYERLGFQEVPGYGSMEKKL